MSKTRHAERRRFRRIRAALWHLIELLGHVCGASESRHASVVGRLDMDDLEACALCQTKAYSESVLTLVLTSLEQSAREVRLLDSSLRLSGGS